jgi:hypothetical protein
VLACCRPVLRAFRGHELEQPAPLWRYSRGSQLAGRGWLPRSPEEIWAAISCHPELAKSVSPGLQRSEHGNVRPAGTALANVESYLATRRRVGEIAWHCDHGCAAPRNFAHAAVARWTRGQNCATSRNHHPGGWQFCPPYTDWFHGIGRLGQRAASRSRRAQRSTAANQTADLAAVRARVQRRRQYLCRRAMYAGFCRRRAFRVWLVAILRSSAFGGCKCRRGLRARSHIAGGR